MLIHIKPGWIMRGARSAHDVMYITQKARLRDVPTWSATVNDSYALQGDIVIYLRQDNAQRTWCIIVHDGVMKSIYEGNLGAIC
jgi:hypothetical protein